MSAVSVYAGGVAAEGDGQKPETQVYATSRFGDVQIVVDSIIEFPDGLVGLGGHRYALLSTDPASPFLWLQSLDDPTLALPVTNPHRFFGDYAVELSDSEAESHGLDDDASADVYVTVTASPVLTDITVNLKAPILIRDGKGHQVLNQRPEARVKTPLFPGGATPAPAANAA